MKGASATEDSRNVAEGASAAFGRFGKRTGLFFFPTCTVSDADSRYRQYVGLALIIIAYVGGIIGWSWATFTVDSKPSSPDTTQTRVESPPTEAISVAESETPFAS